MDATLDKDKRLWLLEQKRGIGYATTLTSSLIKTMEEEVEYEKSNGVVETEEV